MPGGHEVKTSESLLKEDETEDGTDEKLVNGQGNMRIKPGTVKDKGLTKDLRKQLTKDPKPPRPAWHDWHASKQT